MNARGVRISVKREFGREKKEMDDSTNHISISSIRAFQLTLRLGPGTIAGGTCVHGHPFYAYEDRTAESKENTTKCSWLTGGG